MAICATCGEENPQRARFCLACGAPLKADGGFGHDERKLVTVLFADVTSSTALGERLDPEELKEVMAAWFGAMRAEIEAEGGTVEKFIGDAVMAAFGVPAAHEDDPERALRAALRMRRRLEDLNTGLHAAHGVELQVRIGVNTGEVMAVTDPLPGEAMVTGDAVNAAARLEQTAEPGEILVSERTARASRDMLFDGPRTLGLRGKGESMRVFTLAGTGTELPRGNTGLRAPIVGRDRELALLRTLFERVAGEARAHLVTIYGDAGIGKSRLMHEFIASLEDAEPSLQIVRGRCLPYGEGVTYWPLAEIIKGVAGILDNDPSDVALAKLRAVGEELLTAEHAVDPVRSTAALAYTLGLEDPGAPIRDLPPRQVRLETHAAWHSFFSALAADRPVVALVEDIHWADAALLDLLEELADGAQGPVLFVCTARPELTGRRTAWGGGRHSFSSVLLEPLPEPEAARLVELLLTVDDLPADIHRAILDRAEGNPFFLEEILRHLIDENRIVTSNGRWRAAADIGHVQIPDTVQAVLAARMDLLSPADKRVLQEAAVVGRTFWTGPVAALSGTEADDLEDALRRLEERELVVPRLGTSMAGEREFMFKHILTRNVAYETLPRRERAPAHARVAVWIEETAGERRREFVELLAHHYGEAHRGLALDRLADQSEIEDLRAKAVEYLLLAARDALSKMALGRGRELADEARSLGAQPLERSLALEALAEGYNLDYLGDEAWRCFREAIDVRLEGVSEDRTEIARLCGRALEVPTRWPGTMRSPPAEDEAAFYLDAGLERLEPGDSEARIRLLIAQAFWSYAYEESARVRSDRADARAAGEEAAAMALRLGRPSLALAALDGVQAMDLTSGLFAQAVVVAEKRLDLIRTVEDPWERADTFGMASWAALYAGRLADAHRLADEGFGPAFRVTSAGALQCLSNRALASFCLGDWDGLLADLDLTQEILGAGRDPIPGGARPWAAAAFAHEARGDTTAADHLVTLVTRAETGLGRVAGQVSPWLIRFAIRRGDLDSARARLEKAMDQRIGGNSGFLIEVACELAAEEGAWDQAASLAADARAMAEKGGSLELPCVADRLEGQAASVAGDQSVAIELFGRAARGFESIGARWERARTELALAEALAAGGNEGEARQHVSAALPALEAAGALEELERARELAERLGG
jgi:class 3 adenylate cyclase/tetratricopeptide (TPR) repeat protein